MGVAKVHKNIVERLFFKCKAEATETVFVFSKFIQNIESLLSGIADNFINGISLCCRCFL